MNNGTMQVLNLLIGIFLGRLLPPGEYGLVGVLTIFTLIAGNLQSSGFTQGLIVSALLVFGRFGWLGKIAGAVLGMMMIGNNSSLNQVFGGSRASHNTPSESKQPEVEHTNGGGRRR